MLTISLMNDGTWTDCSCAAAARNGVRTGVVVCGGIRAVPVRAFAPLPVRAPLFPANGHSSAKCYRLSA
ncbi:MAG: hypothetical protein OXU61_07760, partial [Gammaproteobacteria bacterium]|nr:hypothetical protein [Gammaproteobacteria bacterium]